MEEATIFEQRVSDEIESCVAKKKIRCESEKSGDESFTRVDLVSRYSVVPNSFATPVHRTYIHRTYGHQHSFLPFVFIRGS